MNVAEDTMPRVAPASAISGPPQGSWTYADYAALPNDGYRYEVIDGVLYMTPAPGTGHQTVSGWLSFYLMAHVQVPGLGRVFCAPYDVELAPDVVVQPDLVVVLAENSGIITPSRIVGSPDLLIEIASPSTAGYDRRAKQDAYAGAGVGEFWIVDPATRTIELMRLADGAYTTVGIYQGRALLPSKVVPELPVRVEQLFG